MSTRTALRATQDAYTNSDVGNRNYGDKPGLRVGDSTYRSFVSFSLKTLGIDAVLQEAWLRLHLKFAWDGTHEITVKRITSRWRESTITANNQPNVTDVNDATLTVVDGLADELIEIDVTAMIAQAIAGANFHGIRITCDGDEVLRFHASEARDHAFRPHLLLVYSEEVTPPTNLHPRAAHAVNASKPVLAWDVDTQSASWVQVATSEDDFDPETGFPSPEFDDGDWVVNTESLYDLSTTGYSGAPDDSTRFWTVKIKDEDGNESEFAEPVKFERHTYGTFAIDSPTTDVSTHTPTVLTTFADRTLTRIDWTLQRWIDKVGIYTIPGMWFDVAEGTSEDDDFEISGVKGRGADYRLIARAFDEFRRGNVPNETSYVRDSVEFSYVPGAPDPVADLVVVQQSGYSPVLDATWTIANAPDEFALYLNDELVEIVESGDAFVSGTDYAWTFYRAVPEEANEIKVVAVEDNEHSEAVAATITPNVIASWLIMPDDGLVVPVFGKGRKPTFGSGVPESGETKLPLSGNPVRVVDAMGGLKGKLDGDLIAVSAVGGDLSAAEARARVLAIKRAGPTEHVRLAWGHRNIRIVLDDLTALDEGFEPEENYRVEATFWQVDET